jgi:hypothetical protein
MKPAAVLCTARYLHSVVQNSAAHYQFMNMDNSDDGRSRGDQQRHMYCTYAM